MKLAPLALLSCCLTTLAAQPERRLAAPRQPRQNSDCIRVPARPFDLLVARPTSNSVLLSVLCHEETAGCVALGKTCTLSDSATARQTFRGGEPAKILLQRLEPDTDYYYQLRTDLTNSPMMRFHTARPAGREFVFTVTADSHLDENTDPALYRRTLARAAADRPDFHVDLGDTFMTEKHESREDAARQYLAQRFYFSPLCAQAPVYLVLGNHDGESPRGGPADGQSLALWALGQRTRYFPNPEPDGFYTGNRQPHPQAGSLQNYYAWTWGDALFVVLDPYWHAQTRRGRTDNWSQSLGTEQYQWLRRTLEASEARQKFIFIHQLIGGLENQGRGGAEAAPFFEWGGRNPDGSQGFERNRPGWPMPVHDLLKRARASIVFHGHDHLYAREELDRVVYQAVPQPGCPAGPGVPAFARDYGYTQGKILPGPGYLRVTAGPAGARVDYVRTQFPGAGVVAHSYVAMATAGG